MVMSVCRYEAFFRGVGEVSSTESVTYILVVKEGGLAKRIVVAIVYLTLSNGTRKNYRTETQSTMGCSYIAKTSDLIGLNMKIAKVKRYIRYHFPNLDIVCLLSSGVT